MENAASGISEHLRYDARTVGGLLNYFDGTLDSVKELFAKRRNPLFAIPCGLDEFHRGIGVVNYSHSIASRADRITSS